MYYALRSQLELRAYQLHVSQLLNSFSSTSYIKSKKAVGPHSVTGNAPQETNNEILKLRTLEVYHGGHSVTCSCAPFISASAPKQERRSDRGSFISAIGRSSYGEQLRGSRSGYLERCLPSPLPRWEGFQSEPCPECDMLSFGNLMRGDGNRVASDVQ